MLLFILSSLVKEMPLKMNNEKLKGFSTELIFYVCSTRDESIFLFMLHSGASQLNSLFSTMFYSSFSLYTPTTIIFPYNIILI